MQYRETRIRKVVALAYAELMQLHSIHAVVQLEYGKEVPASQKAKESSEYGSKYKDRQPYARHTCAQNSICGEDLCTVFLIQLTRCVGNRKGAG